MRLPKQNEESSKSPDVISIDDADDPSRDNTEEDESQPISIEDSDEPEVLCKDDTDRSKDENNEESWKDDDFLSFRPDDEEDESIDKKESQGKKKSSSLLSQISSSYNTTVNHTERVELPPWMDTFSSGPPAHQYYQIPPMVKLHNEIADFAKLMAPQEEEIKEREKLTIRVKDLIISTFGGIHKVSCPILQYTTPIKIVLFFPANKFCTFFNRNYLSHFSESQNTHQLGTISISFKKIIQKILNWIFPSHHKLFRIISAMSKYSGHKKQVFFYQHLT